MSEPENQRKSKTTQVPKVSKREEEALGVNIPITRRDFVGATMVGTGAALLGMAAPSIVRNNSAAAQTTGLPLTGLKPEWTGPGGLGDYAQSNGNTYEVVNAAHGAIRNGKLDTIIRDAIDTGEVHDLIVVGCGIAGLAGGYIFNKERPAASVLLLDQHPMFGGEAKQNEFEVDGTHLTGPQGSTGIVVPWAKAKEVGMYSDFVKELGYENEWTYQNATGMSKDILIPQDMWSPMHIAWERSDVGFYYEGKGWAKNPWSNGFKDTPLSEASRMAMLQMDLYRTPPRRKDWEQWLDSMTYQDFLINEVGLDPKVMGDITQYINPVFASMGGGLGADVVSAYQAYNFLQPGVNGYYRYQNGGEDPTDVLQLATFPGGNAITARRFVQRMIPGAFHAPRLYDLINAPLNWKTLDQPNQPVRMRLRATVVAVEHDGPPDRAKGVKVTYLKGDVSGHKLYTVRAKAVIVAGQQHANKHICRDIPAEVREAMGHFNHAPMLVVNVALRNWKFLEKLGIASARWFEGFGWWTSLRRNLVVDGVMTQPLDPNKPYVLTMYIPFPLPGVPYPEQCTSARMELFGMSYKEIELGVRTQFTKMFGSAGFDAKRDIAGIVANRWGHAYVTDPPGFFFGKNGKPAPKDVIRQRFNRMAFAHSELTGAQMWEAAADEGQRAAHQILEII